MEMKAQANYKKTPNSSQQAHLKKKKTILRIVSPANRSSNTGGIPALQLFPTSKDPSHHGTGQLPGPYPQTCKNKSSFKSAAAAKNGSNAEAKKAAGLKSDQKKSLKKALGGKAVAKKHGIQQIQMVYLNPSHAGSRRSSSVRSN